MLPFLGHNDWNLDFASNWNSPENQRVHAAGRCRRSSIRPSVRPPRSATYPVTHYVGAAGVGEDAAGLPADDPRAGVFGYERQTRQQDLVRGGANTIAVMGVQDRCGPWAQGGRSTVRPLTQRPYINGPDGFGSGQADGMVVGMADGSARFLSDKIDPEILEKLVAVHGGDKVDMSAMDPAPGSRRHCGAPAALEQPLVALPPVPVKPPPPVVKPKSSPPLDPRLRGAAWRAGAEAFALQDAAGRRRAARRVGRRAQGELRSRRDGRAWRLAPRSGLDRSGRRHRGHAAGPDRLCAEHGPRGGERPDRAYQQARVPRGTANHPLHGLRFDPRRPACGGCIGRPDPALRRTRFVAIAPRRRHDGRLAERHQDHADRPRASSDRRLLREAPRRPRLAHPQPFGPASNSVSKLGCRGRSRYSATPRPSTPSRARRWPTYWSSSSSPPGRNSSSTVPRWPRPA